MKINGIPVVDANRKLELEILSQDVSKGKTKDPGSCAAALACIRQCYAEAARVHIGRTYVLKNKKWTRYHTPAALRMEIISFDRGMKFEPGKYTLAPMQPSHRGSGKRHGSNKPNIGKKKRAKPHVITGIRAHGANR